MTTRTLPSDGVDLDGTLRVLAMLPGDPTLQLGPGRLERATLTPEGPGVLTATWRPGGTTVEVRTLGDGAAWLDARAQSMLGLHDDGGGFEPGDGPVRRLWRERRGLRVPRTGTLWHDLLWLIVQQRIRRDDAARQWRSLVTRYGTPAPGTPGLTVPPAPDRLAGLPYHELHRIGIERRRSEHLRAAAKLAAAVVPLADRPVGEAVPVLQAVPGVGPWTTGTLTAVTWGDPDAVIVGDSGIPALVGWVLAGERTTDDARMLALLEPFRPHRYRVLQLAFASGARPPRRSPHRPSVDVARF